MDLEYAPASTFADAKLEDFEIIGQGGPLPVQEEPLRQEEKPAVEEKPVEEKPVEEKPVEEKPKQEEAVVEKPQEQEKPKATIEEKPIVKTREEQLKEMGLDDDLIGLVNHRLVTGSLQDYLKAMSVNYKDMSPEEIMKHDLQEQYPNLSKESFDRLYKKRVTDHYTLDANEYEAEDVALGKEMLTHDAEAKRQQFLEKQQKFMIKDLPERPAQADKETVRNEILQEFSQEQTNHQQAILTNADTQALLKDKKFVLNGGSKEYSYAFEPDNPEDVVKLAANGEEYQKLITKADGTQDTAKILRIANYAKNEEKIVASLIKYGMSLGLKNHVEKDLEHTEGKEVVMADDDEPKDIAEAFLKHGVKSWQTKK